MIVSRGLPSGLSDLSRTLNSKTPTLNPACTSQVPKTMARIPSMFGIQALIWVYLGGPGKLQTPKSSTTGSLCRQSAAMTALKVPELARCFADLRSSLAVASLASCTSGLRLWCVLCLKL